MSMASLTGAATKAPTYYDKGSVELAVESPVMMKKLEKRAHLTDNSELLLIVLVGLPARGKSFIARKLLNYLTWRGNKCRIFNVGKYRRQAVAELPHEAHDRHVDAHGKRQKAGSCDADFFDDSNPTAVRLRQMAAQMALTDALKWLTTPPDDEDILSRSNHSLGSLDESPGFADGHTSHSFRRQHQRIAVFDATNSTKERRQWTLQECAKSNETTGKQTGVVFVESICDDKDLLAENFQVKISSCPDFKDMTREEALEDLRARVQKYESRYEPIDDLSLSYIKIFNLSSRLEVNHIYGRLAKVVVPAMMSWNVGSRPVYLCRAGETKPTQLLYNNMEQHTQQPTSQQAETASRRGPPKRMKGDRLSPAGLKFRDALARYVAQEGVEFMERKNLNVIHPKKLDTGTSITGLYPKNIYETSKPDSGIPFPCLVMSSTLPRALETATAWNYPFQVKDISNLNPLDMGDFAGMDLPTIRKLHPDWYSELKREPFHTRFPGGESYSDLINRLESVVIDMEQQLGLVVVVSHVSVLQVLVAYFRSIPIEKCTEIIIPMHTVLKFVPLRGGGWLESHHQLTGSDDRNEAAHENGAIKEPIWGVRGSSLPQHNGTGQS